MVYNQFPQTFWVANLRVYLKFPAIIAPVFHAEFRGEAFGHGFNTVAPQGSLKEPFEKFWKLSPGKQAEQMVRAGVLYD